MFNLKENNKVILNVYSSLVLLSFIAWIDIINLVILFQ